MAIKEERIIITYDLDFGELYRNFGASSLILRLRTKKTATVITYLTNFLHRVKTQSKPAPELDLLEIITFAFYCVIDHFEAIFTVLLLRWKIR